MPKGKKKSKKKGLKGKVIEEIVIKGQAPNDISDDNKNNGKEEKKLPLSSKLKINGVEHDVTFHMLPKAESGKEKETFHEFFKKQLGENADEKKLNDFVDKCMNIEIDKELNAGAVAMEQDGKFTVYITGDVYTYQDGKITGFDMDKIMKLAESSISELQNEKENSKKEKEEKNEYVKIEEQEDKEKEEEKEEEKEVKIEEDKKEEVNEEKQEDDKEVKTEETTDKKDQPEKNEDYKTSQETLLLQNQIEEDLQKENESPSINDSVEDLSLVESKNKEIEEPEI